MPVTAAQIEGRSVTPPLPPQAAVKVRVTRKGHGKIATGVHDNTFGDELYAADEEFSVAENIALELEDRGFVVFVKEEAPKPAKAAPKDE
jgi:diaminopimelate decarboxylase